MENRCLAVIGIAFLILLNGCAHRESYKTEFHPKVEKLSNAAAFDKITLGIAKFEDKRALIEASNPQSEGYVSKRGPNHVGITYKGKEYMPVKNIIQDILVQEMTNAGFNTKPIDKVLSSSNLASINSLGDTQKVDYMLLGQILSFNSDLNAGFATVKNDKTIILNIQLFRSKDMYLVMDLPVTASESKEYAMGMVISIAVHNLVNETMKIATDQIVQKVAEKVSFDLMPANK